MKVFVSFLVASSVAVGVSGEPVIAATTWLTANSVATGDQDFAAIATNRNGDVAVVWEDDRDSSAPENNNHSEILLRLWRNGTAAYEIKLSGGGTSGTNWTHLAPDVGLDDKGNAVVVWADDPDGNGYYNVPYRVVAPSGAIRASGRANASAAGQQLWPKVAVDPDGTPGNAAAVAFTVVWEDKQGTNPPAIKASGYTNLTSKAYEVTVSQAGGTHTRPDVAVSASGDALVVWQEDADGNGYYNIGLTRLAKANGAINLSRRIANADGGGQQYRPAIAANFNGDFAVAWESDHTGVLGVWTRSFSYAAAAGHGEVEVAAGGRTPGVGLDDQRHTVVGWTVPGAAADVWVAGYHPDGTGAGRLAPQALMRVSRGRQEGMVVAVSAWGEVSVAYTDDNDGNGWDQIYLGLGILNSAW